MSERENLKMTPKFLAMITETEIVTKIGDFFEKAMLKSH